MFYPLSFSFCSVPKSVSEATLVHTKSYVASINAMNNVASETLFGTEQTEEDKG
jgi:hypothetical protein